MIDSDIRVLGTRVGSLLSFLSPARPLSMAISAGGALPAAVSDGTTVAGNEASATVSARLRSL